MKRYVDLKLSHSVAGDEGGPWERYKRIRSCAHRKSANELRGAGLRGGIALCGSGPSLAGQLPEIRRLVKSGYKVAATNTAHDYLWDNGIQVDLAAALDARPHVATYFKRPHKETTYLISSQVHPSVWDALEGQDVYCWHNIAAGDDERGMKWLEKMTGVPERQWVRGGNTISLRLFTMLMPEWIGFRDVPIFGLDSCVDNGAVHVAAKDASAVVDKNLAPFRIADPENGNPLDRVYWCNPSMADQARWGEEMFLKIARAQLAGHYPRWFRFWFNGRGYLPDMMALYGFHKDAKAIRDELRRSAPKVIYADQDDKLVVDFGPKPPSMLTVDADFFMKGAA